MKVILQIYICSRIDPKFISFIESLSRRNYKIIIFDGQKTHPRAISIKSLLSRLKKVNPNLISNSSRKEKFIQRWKQLLDFKEIQNYDYLIFLRSDISMDLEEFDIAFKNFERADLDVLFVKNYEISIGTDIPFIRRFFLKNHMSDIFFISRIEPTLLLSKNIIENCLKLDSKELFFTNKYKEYFRKLSLPSVYFLKYCPEAVINLCSVRLRKKKVTIDSLTWNYFSKKEANHRYLINLFDYVFRYPLFTKK